MVDDYFSLDEEGENISIWIANALKVINSRQEYWKPESTSLREQNAKLCLRRVDVRRYTPGIYCSHSCISHSRLVGQHQFREIRHVWVQRRPSKRLSHLPMDFEPGDDIFVNN